MYMQCTQYGPERAHSGHSSVHVHVLVLHRSLQTCMYVSAFCSSSTLENYAMWQFIFQYFPYLGQDYLNAYGVYSGKIGLSIQPQRYATCVQVAQSIMPMALARPYTDSVLPAGSKVSHVQHALRVHMCSKSNVCWCSVQCTCRVHDMTVGMEGHLSVLHV